MKLTIRLPECTDDLTEEEKYNLEQKKFWDEHYKIEEHLQQSYQIQQIRKTLYEDLKNELNELKAEDNYRKNTIEHILINLDMLNSQMEMLNKYLAAAQKYKNLSADFD